MKPANILVAGFAALALCSSVAIADPAPADPAGAHEDWRQHACTEHAARLNGRLAYLEVKLDLTAEQRPLWDKWRAAAADGSAKVRALCLQHVPKPDARPTIVERLAHIQEMLAAKAAALQAVQPSLAALYQSLTPEQRETFEHGLKMGHGRHHHFHHHGWAHDGHGMGEDHGGDGHDRGHGHE